MPHLAISLLGPLEVTLDGSSIQFPTDKVRALLAYLAVESGRQHPRESLAGLLWPDYAEMSARQSLSQALFSLRTALGDRAAGDRAAGDRAAGDHPAHPPFLLITRDTVSLNPSCAYELDIAELDQALAAIPDMVATEAIARLQAAAARYRGTFLLGFALGDSATFEEWITARREEYHRRFLAVLQRLAELHEQERAYGSAEKWARRRVELDPLNEEAQRQLMRLLALGGQRSAALAQYQACRRLLADDLGLQPEPETAALYEAIRSGALVASPPTATGLTHSLLPMTDVSLPFSESPRLPVTESPPPPFVAREQELAHLEQWLALALQGEGRVAFVVGEPGSGKTALLHEFARRAMQQHPDLIVAGGSGKAYTGLGDPYLPFVEILQRLTGDADPRQAGGVLTPEAARRLRALFPLAMQVLVEQGPELLDTFLPGADLLRRAQAWAPESAPWRARLDDLVQASAAGRGYPGLPQGALLGRCARVLCALASAHPLLLLLDDLQWADASSASLLFHLGRTLASHRILVLGAYRPAEVAAGRGGEQHPLEPVVHEFHQLWSDMTVDLSQAEGRRFVDALIDSAPNRLSSAFRETLYRHTEGQALFTVELLRGLQQRGDLQRNPEGYWVEGATPDWATLPTRVEAVIAQQMQRLPQRLRALLTVASVEGEEFTAEVAARVQCPGDERGVVASLIDELGGQRHLVHALGAQRALLSAAVGQRLSRYRFRHHLYQAYLYHSLDEVRCAALHEQVGHALEALYGAAPPQAPLDPSSWGPIRLGVAEKTYVEATGAVIAPQLAWHFEQAGLVDRAVAYLQQAAERAIYAVAYQEAAAHLAHAITLVQSLSDASSSHPDAAQRRAWLHTEYLLQINLANVLGIARGFALPEFGQAFQRAHLLAQQLGDIGPICESLAGVADFHRNRAEYDRSLRLEEQGLAWAQRETSGYEQVRFFIMIGHSLLRRGEFVAARRRMEEALRLAECLQGEFPVPISYLVYCAMDHLIPALWYLGYPDQASQMDERGPGASRNPDLAHPARGYLLGFRRAWEDLREHANSQLGRAPEESWWGGEAPWALMILGWAHAHTGHAAQGIAEMQRGLAGWHASGNKVCLSQLLTMLGEGYALAGRFDEGLACLEDALAHVARTGERYYEAQVHHVKGQVLLQRGANPEEVETCHRQAIEVARQQEARSWELRATTSLARLLQQQGRVAEAREMLATIYNWFTEGFDTPDLQEAKALLEELKASGHLSGS